MKSFAFILLASACAAQPAASDLDLASSDMLDVSTKLDAPGWDTAPTLHEGTHFVDHAAAQSRRVHSLWVAGSNMNHVPLVVGARAVDTEDVRIAVLGPLADNGTRAVLAADGYTSRKRSVEVTLDVSQPGEHLVVIGSYNLASETTYDVAAACPGDDGCGVSRYDVLATPKDGALVGDAQRSIEMILGDVMVGHDYDVEVELWASPPMQPHAAQLVATSTASGTQVNAIVPASVAAGDDIRLVAKTPDGQILDSGVATRFAPAPGSFARVDSVIYGNNASVQIGGVVGFFEGVADLHLRSETRKLELAGDVIRVNRPGQEGNGYGAFDATFSPDVEGAPQLAPQDGELLSVGFIGGDGEYHPLGCFEYRGPARECD